MMFCATTAGDMCLTMMAETPVMANNTKSMVKPSTPTVLPSSTTQHHSHRRGSKKDQVNSIGIRICNLIFVCKIEVTFSEYEEIRM